MSKLSRSCISSPDTGQKKGFFPWSRRPVTPPAISTSTDDIPQPTSRLLPLQQHTYPERAVYDVHVVVVGGGMSGLSAGLKLLSHGCDVCILESRNTVGGRIHSLPLTSPPNLPHYMQHQHIRARMRAEQPRQREGKRRYTRGKSMSVAMSMSQTISSTPTSYPRLEEDPWDLTSSRQTSEPPPIRTRTSTYSSYAPPQHYVDVGASYIGQTQYRLRRMIHEMEMQMRYVHTYGQHVITQDGKSRKYVGSSPLLPPWSSLDLNAIYIRIHQLQSLLSCTHPWDASTRTTTRIPSTIPVSKFVLANDNTSISPITQRIYAMWESLPESVTSTIISLTSTITTFILSTLHQHAPTLDPLHLDTMTVADWLSQHAWTHDTHDIISMTVRRLLYVEPSEVSMLYFLFYIASAGGLPHVMSHHMTWKLEGGMHGLTERMAERIRTWQLGVDEWGGQQHDVHDVAYDEEKYDGTYGEDGWDETQSYSRQQSQTTQTAQTQTQTQTQHHHQQQQLPRIMCNEIVESIVYYDGDHVGADLNTPPRFYITCRSGLILRSRFVIIAMPPSCYASITIRPNLPFGKQQLMLRMPMGSGIKTIVQYQRPWWRAKGYSGSLLNDSHLSSTSHPHDDMDEHTLTLGPPITHACDDCSHIHHIISCPFYAQQHIHGIPVWDHECECDRENRMYAIVGFIVGKQARRWCQMTKSQRYAAILTQYYNAFGHDVECYAPIGYQEYDWCADPWSKGAPMGCMPPQVITTFGHELRPPVILDRIPASQRHSISPLRQQQQQLRIHGTLSSDITSISPRPYTTLSAPLPNTSSSSSMPSHLSCHLLFASSECATTWAGSIDGAIQAGERAAHHILTQRFHEQSKLSHPPLQPIRDPGPWNELEPPPDGEIPVSYVPTAIEHYLPSIPQLMWAIAFFLFLAWLRT